LADINMKLLSLNKGATHGYANEACWARYTVEQGKLSGQKPPLKLKEIWAIRIGLQLDNLGFPSPTVARAAPTGTLRS
jgi:hypothetical protein